jgi:hypothetical protein
MIDLYNTLLDVRARGAEADRRIGLSHAMGGSGRPRMIDLYNTRMTDLLTTLSDHLVKCSHRHALVTYCA